MIKQLIAAIVLTAPSAAAADQPIWQLTASPSLTLMRDRATPLHATVYDKPVTHPRIVHSTLREPSTGALLGTQWLTICEVAGNRCQTPVSLGKGSHPLFLVVDQNFKGKGEFKGSVYFEIDEKPEPTPLEFAVFGSSYGAWLGGCASILFGVLLSVGGTVVLRQWSQRLDALAPVALLASQLDDIDGIVDKTGETIAFNFPATRRHVSDLRRSLSESTLDARNLLPRRLGNPMGGDASLDQYRAYLADKSEEIAALATVLHQGMPKLADAWKAHPTHQAVVIARDALDELAGTPTKLAEVPEAVARIVAKMDAALAPPGGVAAPQVGSASTIRSSVEIRTLQSRVAVVAWGIWAIVTVLAGTAALVVSNNGFGVPLDYFKCFFWGLGLQATGQQLQQLTPSGVASSFKLSMPK